MAGPNEKIVRRVVKVLNTCESVDEAIATGVEELWDPEIEYVNPAGAVEPGTRHGRTAFARAVEKVYEGWETWQMEPEQFEDVGDQVAVVLRYRARGRGSGVEVEGRESALWTLRNGKVAR